MELDRKQCHHHRRCQRYFHCCLENVILVRVCVIRFVLPITPLLSSSSSTGEGFNEMGSFFSSRSIIRPEVFGAAQCMDDLTVSFMLRHWEYFIAIPDDLQASYKFLSFKSVKVSFACNGLSCVILAHYKTSRTSFAILSTYL